MYLVISSPLTTIIKSTNEPNRIESSIGIYHSNNIERHSKPLSSHLLPFPPSSNFLTTYSTASTRFARDPPSLPLFLPPIRVLHGCPFPPVDSAAGVKFRGRPVPLCFTAEAKLAPATVPTSLRNPLRRTLFPSSFRPAPFLRVPRDCKITWRIKRRHGRDQILSSSRLRSTCVHFYIGRGEGDEDCISRWMISGSVRKIALRCEVQ